MNGMGCNLSVSVNLLYVQKYYNALILSILTEKNKWKRMRYNLDII